MTIKTYWVAKARCHETNETVKSQNLAGRYQHDQRQQCLLEAEYLAARMQHKTGRIWTAFVESYELQRDLNRL